MNPKLFALLQILLVCIVIFVCMFSNGRFSTDWIEEFSLVYLVVLGVLAFMKVIKEIKDE